MRLTASQIQATKPGSEKTHGTVRSRLFGGRAGISQRGFTLVELVMAIVIVGILAVFVAPRLFSASIFQARGFADQVQATLRYAQKEAIAQRRFACVSFTSTTVTLWTGTTIPCGTPFPAISGSGNYVVTSPSSSITISPVPASLAFNGLGQPQPNAQTTVVAGGTTITVEAETGYVHQ
jgi:MSHA pilin protein MshC